LQLYPASSNNLLCPSSAGAEVGRSYKMNKVRITRTIEIFGDKDWADLVLSKSFLKAENDQYGTPHGVVTCISMKQEDIPVI
jgi:hypothetical protein